MIKVAQVTEQPKYLEYKLEMNEVEFAILDDILVLFCDAYYEHTHGRLQGLDESYVTKNRRDVAARIRTAIRSSGIDNTHAERDDYEVS